VDWELISSVLVMVFCGVALYMLAEGAAMYGDTSQKTTVLLPGNTKFHILTY